MRGLRPAGAGERRRRRGGGNLSHGGEKRAEARGESEAALLYRGAYEAGGEYRNLAENPADQRGGIEAYPHATANVETRNESGFAARNVIDGEHIACGHGEWPFGSWGIGAREDAWCRIDFGREVTVDAMALILRADFPHDAYWVSGHVVLSDGAEVAFDLQKTGERQIIPLGKHTVRWMRLERMQKSDDPSAFPALTEWEVYGCDKEGE